MGRALVVIDMQNGFINKSTKPLVKYISRFINEHGAYFDKIIATRYINNSHTPCYIFEGVEGLYAGFR
jgi:nicotinamidase-related amidase